MLVKQIPRPSNAPPRPPPTAMIVGGRDQGRGGRDGRRESVPPASPPDPQPSTLNPQPSTLSPQPSHAAPPSPATDRAASRRSRDRRLRHVSRQTVGTDGRPL